MRRKFPFERGLEVGRYGARKIPSIGMPIQNHEPDIVFGYRRQNTRRSACRIIVEIVERSRGVAKTVKEVNFWAIRCGVNVFAAGMLAEENAQLFISPG